MSALRVGDVIRDNLGREGLVLAPGRRPTSKWLQDQEDTRMVAAVGPWWKIAPFDGGGVLVPDDLAVFLRRATVDDVVLVMACDSVDSGNSTLRFLFGQLAAARKKPKK
jgi:hypothetical protein